jgi:hypothetical protein
MVIFLLSNYIKLTILPKLNIVDTGPIGFPSNMTASRGPWLGPRTRARRGATSATPSPSRIGQTSRIPMESNFCV